MTVFIKRSVIEKNGQTHPDSHLNKKERYLNFRDSAR